MTHNQTGLILKQHFELHNLHLNEPVTEILEPNHHLLEVKQIEPHHLRHINRHHSESPPSKILNLDKVVTGLIVPVKTTLAGHFVIDVILESDYLAFVDLVVASVVVLGDDKVQSADTVEKQVQHFLAFMIKILALGGVDDADTLLQPVEHLPLLGLELLE